MSTRKLKVFGHCIDAIGSVTVNGTLIHHGKFNEPCLYEFETDTTLHGNVDIAINLTQGILSIESIQAVYPAWINNKINGWYAFKQPIENPLIDPISKQPFLTPHKVTDKLIYKHLMFNGPTKFNVLIDSPVNLVDGVEIHESLVDYIKAQWDYTPLVHDLNNLLKW